jgi:hypothetical protein
MTPGAAAKKLLRGVRVRIGFRARYDSAFMGKVLNIKCAVQDFKRFDAYMNKAGEVVLAPLNGGSGFNSAMEPGAVDWEARAVTWARDVKQAMIKKSLKKGVAV